MRLLVIEDELKTANFIQKGLSESGFIVDVAHDGAEAIFLASNQSYDLIILDVMLPKIDGWSVAYTLSQQNANLPILFLTARDSVADCVKGLEMGSDYLIKPLAFTELLARVRNILHKKNSTPSDIITIADLQIDLLRQKTYRGGQMINLIGKEFLLLSLLARRKGGVVSRTIITEQMWDMNYDCDANVLDVVIRRLRRKIDDPYPKKLIHTIRSVGYILEERE